MLRVHTKNMEAFVDRYFPHRTFLYNKIANPFATHELMDNHNYMDIEADWVVKSGSCQVITEWLQENIGYNATIRGHLNRPNGDLLIDETGHWIMAWTYAIAFKSEEHALMFRMKWL